MKRKIEKYLAKKQGCDIANIRLTEDKKRFDLLINDIDGIILAIQGKSNRSNNSFKNSSQQPLRSNAMSGRLPNTTEGKRMAIYSNTKRPRSHTALTSAAMNQNKLPYSQQNCIMQNNWNSHTNLGRAMDEKLYLGPPPPIVPSHSADGKENANNTSGVNKINHQHPYASYNNSYQPQGSTLKTTDGSMTLPFRNAYNNQSNNASFFTFNDTTRHPTMKKQKTSSNQQNIVSSLSSSSSTVSSDVMMVGMTPIADINKPTNYWSNMTDKDLQQFFSPSNFENTKELSEQNNIKNNNMILEEDNCDNNIPQEQPSDAVVSSSNQQQQKRTEMSMAHVTIGSNASNVINPSFDDNELSEFCRVVISPIAYTNKNVDSKKAPVTVNDSITNTVVPDIINSEKVIVSNDDNEELKEIKNILSLNSYEDLSMNRNINDNPTKNIDNVVSPPTKEPDITIKPSKKEVVVETNTINNDETRDEAAFSNDEFIDDVRTPLGSIYEESVEKFWSSDSFLTFSPLKSPYQRPNSTTSNGTQPELFNQISMTGKFGYFDIVFILKYFLISNL